MSGLWIALAVGAAVLAVGWKASRKALLERRFASLPGRSPKNPLPISSFTEMDEVIEDATCLCGGSVRLLSEGGRGSKRVARTVCEMCEDDVDLYFDLSTLRH